MKVRALAKASDHSNAIGVVELDCVPAGLSVLYLGVGAFAEGYAPGALTYGTQILVPWGHVRSARLEGEPLYLELDPALTPHHQLLLDRFATDDHPPPHELRRRQLMLRIAGGAGFVVTVLALSLAVPRFAPQAGAIAGAAVGFVAGLLVLLATLLSERFLAAPRLQGAAARDAFLIELESFFPHVVRTKAPEPKVSPPSLPAFVTMLPRTTAGVVITLSACTLGALLTANWVLEGGNADRRGGEQDYVASQAREADPSFAVADDRVPEEAPAPRPAAAAPASRGEPAAPASTAASAPGHARAPSQATAAVGDSCSCPRSDSLLWQRPVPKLSLLILNAEKRTVGNRKRTRLSLAAVNNSAKDINELSLIVQFFDTDPPPSKRRFHTANRAVYYKGPLEPGEAIKWTVEARGSEFQLENPVEGDIGPGGDGAAALNQLLALQSANHRPVRLHGAMMLAYLGDARARDAALKLKEALREDEAPFLQRVLRATAPLRVCRLQASGTGHARQVQACVFNSSNGPRQSLGLRVRSLDGPLDRRQPLAPPPIVSTEKTFAIPGELAANSGVVVSTDFQLRESLDGLAFEAWADSLDLLY